jgi:hypothetical protein
MFNVGGSGLEPICDQCNKPMLPTTGGHFCPSCGRSSQPGVEGYVETATPKLGLRTVSDETMALAGKSIFASNMKLGPAKEREQPKLMVPTIVKPREPKPALPPKGTTPIPERRAPEPSAEVLTIPRCRSCNNALDLDEIPAGECRKCLALVRPSGEVSRHSVPSGVALGELLTGLVCLMAALWAGMLVLVRAVLSNPDAWRAAQFAEVLTRGGLIILALAASAAWMGGRRWAGGAALALGPLAVGLMVVGLRTGAFLGDLAAASAWILAGLAGMAAAVVAAVPTASGASDPRNESGGDARSIVGGILALLLAVIGIWLSVANAEHFGRSAEFALATVLALLACVAGAAGGILLLARPAASKVHLASVAAVVLAAGMPLWLRVAALVTSSATGINAPVFGLGHCVGLGALSELSTGPVAGVTLATSAAILLLGIALATVVFLRRPGTRGSTFAGFALSWALVWAAGLVCAAAST